MKKKLLVLMGLGMLLVACTQKVEDQSPAAQKWLAEAREALSEGRYEEARTAIDSLRQWCPKALAERKAAILTMDSVNMLETEAGLPGLETLIASEQQMLDVLTADHHGRNEQFIAQKHRVAFLRDSLDDLEMKVKFYARKIEEDKKK